MVDLNTDNASDRFYMRDQLGVRRDGTTIAHLGDSRVAQGGGSAIGSTLVKNHRYSFHVANALSGQRLTDVGNFGVAGDRTDQAIARLPLVLALKPDFAIWWCAVNNFDQGVGTDATAFTDAKTFADACLSIGTRPILFTEAGSGAAGYGDNATKRGYTHNYNERIREYVDKNPGAILFDEADIMWLPTSTTLGFKSNYSADSLHRSNLGAYMVGKKLKTLFEQIAPPKQFLLSTYSDSWANTARQVADNPLFGTASGGSLSGTATGTVPVNCTANGSTGTTVTSSTEVNAEGYGNNWVCAITGASSVTSGSYGSAWMRTSLQVSRLATGDILEAFAEVEVASPVNIQGIKLVLDVSVGGVVNTISDGAEPTGGGGPTEAFTYVLRTAPFTIPSGTIDFSTLRAEINFSAAGGSATMKVRRLGVRKKYA